MDNALGFKFLLLVLSQIQDLKRNINKSTIRKISSRIKWRYLFSHQFFRSISTRQTSRLCMHACLHKIKFAALSATSFTLGDEGLKLWYYDCELRQHLGSTSISGHWYLPIKLSDLVKLIVASSLLCYRKR